MADYRSCPNCGSQPQNWFAAYMEIYRCDDCGTEFCHRCPGSNGGRECPRCHSQRFRVWGKCYK